MAEDIHQNPTESNQPKRPKYDWYETDQQIVLAVLIKNVNPEHLTIKFEPQRLIFNYETTDSAASNNQPQQNYSLIIDLQRSIVPEQSNWKVSTFKVEIKMQKTDIGHRWQKLEMEPNSQPTIIAPIATVPNVDPSCSSSSSSSTNQKMKCWDDLVKQVEKEDEQEAGVEELFKRIYASGDENLRRAMNKSFVESNGTVLSTNWSEVGKSKVEVKAPDNCQYKQWNK